MQTNLEQPQQQAATLEDVFSLENFQKKHADKFTRSQLLWWIRRRQLNGLAKSGAVILSARKFYISEQLFTNWFTNQKA